MLKEKRRNEDVDAGCVTIRDDRDWDAERANGTTLAVKKRLPEKNGALIEKTGSGDEIKKNNS